MEHYDCEIPSVLKTSCIHGKAIMKYNSKAITSKKDRFKSYPVLAFFVVNLIALLMLIRMMAVLFSRMDSKNEQASLCVSMETYDDSNSCVCSENAKYDIVLVVNSALENMEKRMTIRKTWGNATYYLQLNLKVKVLFLLGSKYIRDENLKRSITLEKINFKDIINVGVQDTYRNNIIKHMFGIYYSVTKCKSAELFIKTDDDIFLQPDIVYKLYKKNYRHSSPFYCFMVESSPIRDPENKWFIDEKVYNKSFPLYCMGSFYAINMSSLQKVAELMQCHPYFWIDDVHITGEMRKLSKLPIAPMARSMQALFTAEIPFDIFSRWINNTSLRVLYHHKLSPVMIDYLWQQKKKRQESLILPPVKD